VNLYQSIKMRISHERSSPLRYNTHSGSQKHPPYLEVLILSRSGIREENTGHRLTLKKA
jgi:hypothetical protein